MKKINPGKLYALILAGCLLLLGTGVAFAEEAETVDNGLPVVYVTIDESQGTIAAMNESEDHSVHCKGTVKIDVPEGFHYCDMPDTACKSLPETGMDIRGRGNTTWSAKKKPYKIKLDSKENVLGLGKNKHWVLIANAYDHTLIRDRMTGWLGDAIGMEFTPRGVPVDLVMQNTDGSFHKYLGSYYLSENVRIDKNRIEIDELDETVTDPNSLEITGGYLVQGGVQKPLDSPSLFYTSNGELSWANDSPSFDPADGAVVEAQRDYIRNYVQEFENALYSADYSGQNGPSYRDMMDLEAAAKYWLIDAASMNGDGYGTGSTYFYKKRDTVSDGVKTPGKIYWGPLWDFDYAWGDGSEYEEFRLVHDWVLAMLYDNGEGGFFREVKAQWPAVKNALAEMTRDGGIIDQYSDEVRASQAQDYKVNPPDKEAYEKEYVYQEEVDALKVWIDNRVAWMDAHLDDLDNRFLKITFMAEGKIADTKFTEKGNTIPEVIGPEKDGYVFIGWAKEDGTLVKEDTTAEEDLTLNARYLPDSEATHATMLYLRTDEDYVNINEAPLQQYNITCSVLPQDAQDRKVIWESSNEEIASFDEPGLLQLHNVGDVTITATLKYNCSVSKSMKLHVVDTKLPALESVAMDRTSVNMKKGKYTQIRIKCNPVGSAGSYFIFTSSNDKVAEVDDTGVVYAKAPGKATITVAVSGSDANDMTEKVARCKVSVSLAKKKANPIYVKGRTVTLKRSAVAKKPRTIKRKAAIKIKKAKGKLTYKLAGVSDKKYRKYFKVSSKTGKITVKKGIKRGKYKLRIKIRDAGDFSYKAKTRTANVTVRIR